MTQRSEAGPAMQPSRNRPTTAVPRPRGPIRPASDYNRMSNNTLRISRPNYSASNGGGYGGSSRQPSYSPSDRGGNSNSPRYSSPSYSTSAVRVRSTVRHEVHRNIAPHAMADRLPMAPRRLTAALDRRILHLPIGAAAAVWVAAHRPIVHLLTEAAVVGGGGGSSSHSGGGGGGSRGSSGGGHGGRR